MRLSMRIQNDRSSVVSYILDLARLILTARRSGPAVTPGGRTLNPCPIAHGVEVQKRIQRSSFSEHFEPRSVDN